MYKANLKLIGDKVRAKFDQKDQAREKALPLAREVIRHSADAIRAIHRSEFAEAKELIAQNVNILKQIDESLKDHPDLFWAGFVHDAQKEHAEANATYALVNREPLPDPDELGVSASAYMNGLGEAVGELRRHILDEIRTRGSAWGEEMLSSMDDIYYVMVSMDYPGGITGGLKRTSDVTRSIIEKTRGDLTGAIRSQHLEEAMRKLEAKLEELEGPDEGK